MNWYYAEQDRQSGPVDESELDELVRTGTLASSSLVWSEGMTDWKPYSTIKPAPVALNPIAEPLILPKEGACVCCRRQVPPQESVIIGSSLACPECKSIFVERLREADPPNLPGAMPYSGFWIRFTARMADYTLITLLQTVFTGVAIAWTLRSKSPIESDGFAAFGISALAGLALSCTYETYFLSTRGATIGKMLCYLRVVHPDGSPIALGTALGRYFAELLSRIGIGIGYLMAAFDIEKRTLHDRIAGTRVIDAPPPETILTEREPVSRAVRCATCQTDIPPTEWNSLNPLPCPGCGTPVQAIVFPAVARSLDTTVAQAKEGDGEAGCYYHDANRATLTCAECGRFLCPLCDLDAGNRHLCPSCFKGHFTGDRTPEFVQRRTLYDSIALIAAVLPNLFLITIYFTVFTAPAVVGFSIWSWKKQGAITPRANWRFVVALMIASVNLLFIGLIAITLIIGAFKRS